MRSSVVTGLLGSVRANSWLRGHPRVRELVREVFRQSLRTLSLNRGVRKRIGDAGEFRLDPAFLFSSYENWGTRHNAGFTEAVRLARSCRVVFDVGAHIGLYTLPLSRSVGPSGLVVAFEPAKRNLEYLRRHIKYNDLENVRVVPCLVGDTGRSEMRFYESRLADGMGGLVRYKRPENYAESFAAQVTLDDVCEKEALTPELVKIDVEGSEMKVLLGASRLLSRSRPIIVLSVHPRQLRLLDSSVSELFRLVTAYGYSVTTPASQMVQELAMDEYILRPRA